ncbi:hypothetical protein [uncultured Pseudokineococcus sp.]|uniref:hypothetical protein n=1 Tax=uncultured Pseudokineococcus sp. TaxID=1642928 RepID=UPI002623F3A7|nr:hypothetical protein [uncultured Pseudokineococcus sp.]
MIWDYLNRIYGIPEVDNTEHLPDLVTTHAAAIAGLTTFSVERLLRLERLTDRALHHTTGGFHTHPLWESMERRLSAGDAAPLDSFQAPSVF